MSSLRRMKRRVEIELSHLHYTLRFINSRRRRIERLRVESGIQEYDQVISIASSLVSHLSSSRVICFSECGEAEIEVDDQSFRVRPLGRIIGIIPQSMGEEDDAYKLRDALRSRFRSIDEVRRVFVSVPNCVTIDCRRTGYLSVE